MIDVKRPLKHLPCTLWTAIGSYIWKNGFQEGNIRIVSNCLVVGQLVDSDYFCDLTQTECLSV